MLIDATSFVLKSAETEIEPNGYETIYKCQN